MNKIGIHFSDFFGIDTKIVEDYGAFDTSLVNDVPVFIDPFRLYASDKAEYNQLHEQIIDYLRFLCRYSESHKFIDKGNLKNYFCFPEVREIYMGFCKKGNAGRGLGTRFATALRDNFGKILSDFGKEKISQLNIYKAANDTEQGLCVIVYTSDDELKKVDKILASLGLATNPNIILIDASPKTSASKVR